MKKFAVLLLVLTLLAGLSVPAWADGDVAETVYLTATVGSEASWVLNERAGFSAVSVLGIEGEFPEGMETGIGSLGELELSGTPEYGGEYSFTVLAATDGGGTVSVPVILTVGGGIRITRNPEPCRKFVGESASFTAAAENDSSVTWRLLDPKGTVTLNAADLPRYAPEVRVYGCDSETFTIENLPSGLDGWFVEAMFDGPGGPVFTESVCLLVQPIAKPTVLTQPEDLTLKPGESGTIFVEAQSPDGSSVTYRWLRNTKCSDEGAEELPNGDGATLTVSYSETPYYYFCRLCCVRGEGRSGRIYSHASLVSPVKEEPVPTASPAPTATPAPIAVPAATAAPERNDPPAMAPVKNNKNAVAVVLIAIAAACAGAAVTVAKKRK